jgi:gamma-glutamylcyclotransferase (GGCT)/AIG2-like uncharacterized protein YtfP
MRFFFYGTLKRGQAWHGRMLAGKAGVSFVAEDVVDGWSLAPAFGPLVPELPRTVACAVPRPGTEMAGEVFEIENERVIMFVRLLESGYDEQTLVTRAGRECHAFVGKWRGGPTWRVWPFGLSRRCETCGHLWGAYEDTCHCDGGECHNKEACDEVRIYG